MQTHKKTHIVYFILLYHACANLLGGHSLQKQHKPGRYLLGLHPHSERPEHEMSEKGCHARNTAYRPAMLCKSTELSACNKKNYVDKPRPACQINCVGIRSPKDGMQSPKKHTEREGAFRAQVGIQSHRTTNWQVACLAVGCLPRQWRRPELSLVTRFPPIVRWHGSKCP